MILEPLDSLRQNLVISINVQRNGEMIYMMIEELLPSKSLWNAEILPYGCEADTLVDNNELSNNQFTEKPALVV